MTSETFPGDLYIKDNCAECSGEKQCKKCSPGYYLAVS